MVMIVQYVNPAEALSQSTFCLIQTIVNQLKIK